jgi:hypothetical protein
MNLQGNILREFEYPWSAPSGLAFSQNSLWIADILDKKIYKTDTGFNLLATININIDNPSDLTFQGSDIWILGYENPSGTLLKIDKAYKINTSGSLLNTIELPGNINEGAGLAFGNNLLWFANSKAKLIYKIDLSGNTCFSYPNTFQFLAYDGTNFWSFDKQNGNLSKFSQTGELLNSFSLVDQSVTGMTWDGNYLWLLSDNSIESIMKLKKLDASGNIIKTIEVYRPAVVVYHSYGILTYGIVFNNNAFWIFGKGPFGDPMKIYKYSI